MTDNDPQILIEPENPLPDYDIDQLPDVMRSALSAMGWTSLMPVQAKSIPYLLDKRDMIIQSRTGSGKTGAFLIPLLLRLDAARRFPQALILVPTRELASQVYNEFVNISKDFGLRGVLVYGGVGYGAQLQALRDGAQVVVGTPGRVLDHIGRRSLNLDRISVLVFDEADEMLSMGFYPDMREIQRYLPRQRSSWMFSATIPYRVQMLAQEFLQHPEFLSLSSGQVTVQTAEHRIYDVPPLEKDLMLMRLIEMENPDSAIIFCNTKQDVEYLATVLGNYGYDVDLLSGDLDQKEREAAMARIRRGETRFLVATDVAARGIDISDLSHVIQYDVPKDPDSYVHRAGRTARAGNTGVVITLVANMSERSDLKKISRRYNVDFVELPMPTQLELEERLAERLIVVLEDRYRTSRRLERERGKRFVTLVRSLAESEEEVAVLAMLLDDLYHRTYHVGQTAGPPPARTAAITAAITGESREQRGPTQGGQQPAPATPGTESGGEETPRKKKKRRRKKKPVGGSSSDPSATVADATSDDPESPMEQDDITPDVEAFDREQITRSSDPSARATNAIGSRQTGNAGEPEGDVRDDRSQEESERAAQKERRGGAGRGKGTKGDDTKSRGPKIEKVLGSGIMAVVEEIEVFDPDTPSVTTGSTPIEERSVENEQRELGNPTGPAHASPGKVSNRRGAGTPGTESPKHPRRRPAAE